MNQQLLKKINAIVSLTAEEEELLGHYWNERTLNKGEYLLTNGKICRTDNYVIEGALKAYYIDAETGKEEILYFAIENWWASDLYSFQKQLPSIYNIQAVEDTRLLQITNDSFQKMLGAIPKLERFFRIILESYLGTLQRKIIINQVYDAKGRYLDFLEQYPLIAERFPNYLIASYLNVSPEFLSRIRKK